MTRLKHEGAGRKLMLVDDLPPEDLAMLQGLYSRSAESVETHFDRVAKGGSSRFMENYVAGYNHKSIADCGTTTLFIEGVSLLAAKAIQDWPLYSGQETSTRYIDMAKQPMIDPVDSPESLTIQRRWLQFYTESRAEVERHVQAQHPQREGESDKAYAGAVKARTFDILRGFLPAGITTQLSWHTNLRQAGDHLNGLCRHPSAEIQAIGLELRALLTHAYPDSGLAKNLPSVSGVKADRDAERDAWDARVTAETTYVTALPGPSGTFFDFNFLRLSRSERALLADRPRGCVLPHFMTMVGAARILSFLDFGSFRDLQRHRNGVCQMPLLTMAHGFESWYLEQLPLGLHPRVHGLLENQARMIAALPCDEVARQYYMPLGQRVAVDAYYALPALVYILEMRSAKTVHPTLRKLILSIADAFRAELDRPVALHIDTDVDDWTVRRGLQTIEVRGAQGPISPCAGQAGPTGLDPDAAPVNARGRAILSKDMPVGCTHNPNERCEACTEAVRVDQDDTGQKPSTLSSLISGGRDDGQRNHDDGDAP
jgi:thymidylate synthase ThyX